MKTNETYLENLISLLVNKEVEIKELLAYVAELEKVYSELVLKYNALVEKHYSKNKRTMIGYKKDNDEKK